MSQTFILVSDEVKARAITALALSPLGKEVIIQDKRKTPPQRRYWHKLMDLLCEGTGYSLIELKTIIKRQVLGTITFTTRKGELIERDYSSEELSVSEYGKLIDHTLTLGKMAGIELPLSGHYGFEI